MENIQTDEFGLTQEELEEETRILEQMWQEFVLAETIEAENELWKF